MPLFSASSTPSENASICPARLRVVGVFITRARPLSATCVTFGPRSSRIRLMPSQVALVPPRTSPNVPEICHSAPQSRISGPPADMTKVTDSLTLPTTITGSLPRPSWYTEQIGQRAFRDAIADTRFREQYTDAVGTFIRDQERAGLDIVTDGDARFDADVGGMSWIQYPARRLAGLSGGDYARMKKGYGGTRKGDIIFEVMESRVMPRAVGKIGRGTLQYAYLWKLAQGLTARPVKFGTIVPDILGTSLGNDFYATQQELLFALADAMREELDDLARAGCAIIQMEEPNIHLAGVQRGGAPMLAAECFVETLKPSAVGLH